MSDVKTRPRKQSIKYKFWRSESTKLAPNAKHNVPTRRWHSEENMLAKAPCNVPYFYGHITRENAELILWDRGCVEGMYLLRASHNRDAEYVLSVASNKQVLHYLIQKTGDGMYHLSGMSTEKYMGPVELIESIRNSGQPCKLVIACIKPVNTFMPGVNCGISEDRLHEALRKKAAEWDIKEDELRAMLYDKENDVWKLVFKTLHESESWYHGKISRSEAEKRIAKSGHKDGKFLVRERDDCSFSLSLSFNNQHKHYKIDVLPSGEVGIPEGPRFDNIISLVSHYSVFSDGLWHLLKIACVNQTSPTSTSTAISWPIERNSPSIDVSSEPKPAFPTNKAFLNPGAVVRVPSFSSRDSKSTQLKSPTAETSTKIRRDSKSSVKPEERVQALPKEADSVPNKLIPHRPPPPLPVKANITVPSPSVFNSVSNISVPHSGSILEKIHIPIKMPNRTKDKNHNDWVSNSTESNPPVSNSSSSSVSVEQISSELVNGDVPKPRPKPAPRKRLQPIPLVVPQIEVVNQDAKSPSTPFEAPTNVRIISPLPNNKESLPGRIFPSPSSVTGGSKSPNTPISKPSAGAFPVAYSAILIDELKQKVKRDRGKDESTSRSARLNCSSESASSKTNEKLNSKIESPTQLLNSPHPPLQGSESNHSSHIYEEIDPDYMSEQENIISENVSTIKEQDDEGSKLSDSLLSMNVKESTWDEVEENGSLISSRSFARKSLWTKEESELHSKTIKRHRKGPTNIDRRNLLIQERLGEGNFGEVCKAVFQSENDEVPCAVKTLRPDQISNGKEEILKEARIMTEMDHPHIVRLLGICEGTPFLLVMELASLGPLSGYLKRNPTVPNSEILLLIYQVALGMEYLEGRQFVHRDLAARNVLLVNERFAKITDFGMSKALGLHSDYYTVEPQGKLPLKWYAPECIYYFKFSSKSDVWSYGILLWEALSRGGKPYMGMTGREILVMFRNNTRLKQPDNCPDEIYSLMRKCWEFKAEDRPSFSQLVLMLKEHQTLI